MKLFLLSIFFAVSTQSHCQPIEGRISRISSSIGCGSLPVSMATGQYYLSIPGKFGVEKRIDHFSFYSLNFDIRYFLTTTTSLSVSVASASSTTSHFNKISFGANLHRWSSGSKRPFFIEPGLNLTYFALGAGFGEAEIMSSFRLNGKRFSAGTLKIYCGERRIGVGPVIQFRYKINPRLSFFANASTTLASVSKDVVFFQERGRFRSIRSVDRNDELILLRDNVPEKNGPVSLSVYGLSFNGGVQLGIN